MIEHNSDIKRILMLLNESSNNVDVQPDIIDDKINNDNDNMLEKLESLVFKLENYIHRSSEDKVFSEGFESGMFYASTLLRKIINNGDNDDTQNW